LSRRVVLVLALLAVVAAGAGGWVAGTRIKSPAQVAAEAEPPEPSLITVPVSRVVIVNDVITRGSLRNLPCRGCCR
jgi:Flp pilus assembly protein CpaB